MLSKAAIVRYETSGEIDKDFFEHLCRLSNLNKTEQSLPFKMCLDKSFLIDLKGSDEQYYANNE